MPFTQVCHDGHHAVMIMLVQKIARICVECEQSEVQQQSYVQQTAAAGHAAIACLFSMIVQQQPGLWHNACTCTVTKAPLLLLPLSLLKLLGCESCHAHSHSGLLSGQLMFVIILVSNQFSSMLRPYHPDRTPSRPIRKVKLDWAQLVLG